MAAQFQFVMRSGPNTGKTYRLDASEIIVGRDASNTVAINDAEVSRKHARLSLHGSAYVIQDLGSTNGTFVNGQRITGSQVLNIGDTVSFGENIVLIYEAALDPNATIISSAQVPRTVTPVQRPAPVSNYNPAPAQAPVYIPPPSPAYSQPPTPAPIYSGQVPSGPIPMAVQPKKGNKGLVIGIIVVVIILMCICVLLFGFFAPQSVLCAPGIRIISNLVGPMFGYGVCP